MDERGEQNMKVPAYLKAGSGDEALILLHGIGGCADVWQPQLDAFSDRYTVVAWNMPGYRGSEPLAEPMTFPLLADALERLLDHIGARRVHLVGHSMGGMVAQEFVRERADRITSLTLYATNPGLAQPETPAAIAAAKARAEDFMHRRIGPIDAGMTMRQMGESLLDQLLSPDAPLSARQAAIESVGAVPPAIYRDAMRCILSFDGTKIVPMIDKPTLAIAGERDVTITPAAVEAMAKQIGGARFVTIPRVGHLANIEDPPAFNRALAEFLESLPGSG
jgi:3-oxoadipate enol-lactonase